MTLLMKAKKYFMHQQASDICLMMKQLEFVLAVILSNVSCLLDTICMQKKVGFLNLDAIQI